MAAISMSSRFE
ncbi:hypothetical protein CAEBREN_01255 [Caenorhabditis brenneri]|uniref:Uncharacterized protein n=1 Tax=Caenorhabditis brenneri TaxID=135651 RepID=G0NQC6_CAEBE|nr:hypothetical protein CAEBREN_01255 [Caenorhabditis brenneri]